MTYHLSIPPEGLVRACAESNDTVSWEQFVARFHRPISLSIIRIAHRWSGVSQQVVDDLVQETYLKLCADRCALLHSFAQEHPGAIDGYIKTIACNVARDHFKAHYSQKRGAGCDQESLSEIEVASGSSAAGSQDSIEKQILLKQIDRCLDTCATGPDGERDRTIFWLYYQQGMSAKSISSLPAIRLTPKGVESAVARLTRLVREQIVQMRSAAPDNESGKKGFRPAESY